MYENVKPTKPKSYLRFFSDKKTTLKNNTEKHPADSYQEAPRQIADENLIPQEDLYTLAWEVEFGRQLLDIPIIYTDPIASDFDESHRQGTNIAIVPRSCFHDSWGGQ